ncbi:hypothetical protein BDV24DRAFT_162359 [Aspergillus arachidicola]|uniref:Uncharacterized protein n=1 Tax=Aspergillus arachidicola TaxID=656916 RepID=A0A5N6YB68_9EURO|nr:hypothetical protein BDV24DRAFT_162359 [Aspergillus arachidicola]
MPDSWKDSIIGYGLALAGLQRAKRLLNCVDNKKDLIREIENPGHRNRNPYDFPESLLLEVESGLMIRGNQDGLADFIHSDQSQAASLIATRCREFRSVSYHSAKMDEEQEREVAAEAEREQQVQRPPKARPKKHEIYEEMKNLVSTGVIAEGSTAFLPAFRSLDKTSAARHPGVDQFPGKLLVTRDYAQTVEPIYILSFSPDFFQRPVPWILTSRHGSNSTDHKPTVNHMVIISPYEAQELYPSIKDSKHVTLHLYAPRSYLGLKPLDKLHLSSYEEYVEVCDFLGVAWKPMGEDSVVATDGFILRRDKNNRAERLASTFRQSPIKFLKVLMSQVRRKGEGIGKAHMGKMVNGVILHRSDFEEPRRAEQDQVLPKWVHCDIVNHDSGLGSTALGDAIQERGARLAWTRKGCTKGVWSSNCGLFLIGHLCVSWNYANLE